ncbi:hypothetical protein WJX81_003722 [Elliptochloris bilobata]|uniref:SET domain-containing protein n=1 Tax=Elliptochloris bilobata TaxID=381761 RepID=A0AAW1R3Y9_9CHLO
MEPQDGLGEVGALLEASRNAPTERASVSYINQATTPRIIRQGLASRLMGQQLAACLQAAGEPLTPAAVLRGGTQLWDRARRAALAQEVAVFRQAGGKAPYLRAAGLDETSAPAKPCPHLPAIRRFVRALLDPLYDAQVVSREQYKLVAARASLLRWIISRGGKADLVVSANEAGVRGAFAVTVVRPGEIVAKVLAEDCVELASSDDFTAAEQAVVLLQQQHRDTGWNDSLAPYWRSLPQPGELYTKEAFIDEHLRLLQDQQLADYARLHRTWTREVYAGPPGLREALVGENVPLEVFVHAAALVSSYSFVFPSVPGDQSWRELRGRPVRFLVPLLDLLNHATDHNVVVERSPDTGERAFVARAVRPIRPGEELVHSYSSAASRPDRALLDYFFLPKPAAQPLLCAVDLPGGVPWGDSPPDDSTHAPLGEAAQRGAQAGAGSLVTANEAARLEGILAAFPTSEAHDEELIRGGGLGPREAVFVRFRVLRKLALWQAVTRIRAALSAAECGAEL